MRMDLIQPFINSADAVLAQGLESPISIENLSMEEEAYRRKGIAAEVCLTGEIEGRIIFDVDLETAVQLASRWPASKYPRPTIWYGKRCVSWPTRSLATPSPRSTIRDFTFAFIRQPSTLPSKAAKAAKTRKPW